MSGVDWNKNGEKVLLFVDGFNLLWRAAFGFPAAVRNPSGTDVTAVFAFFALLRSSCRVLEAPVECVVCFDGEDGLQSRKAADPEYKQNRIDVDVSPLEWLDDIKNGLDMIGVGQVRAARILADGLTLVEARAAGRLVGAAGAAAEQVWEKGCCQALPTRSERRSTEKNYGERASSPCLSMSSR